MKTSTPKEKDINRAWFLIDASEQVLGRMASQIAAILRGKNKPYFSPHLDVGDYVIVINAEKVKLTGNKEITKLYQRYSGYPGGRTEKTFKRMQQEEPETIIEKAVRGMLPKNILGRQMINKLKVYAGNEHPHVAQQPQKLEL